ncbi:chromosome segregation protein SMC [Marinagarivorans cellulosilyticus]|uniref:Chromosome partition protein Smc n=1 Tax=Marinagarivorans cellulosilyticus TaxID=2721545 RepID=A0AAN2BLD9_9GAMM|nr:chromosome segregation protein SMC [Marinagarivorans cellulosilyticus]BCD98989.1 chromosome segregation protein [Marinagarivorans cellulosilyticus]
MRLKCIKLAGFKSFVDPTTVHFPSNLCAVVGPNGCGKSNIIDAVRWVMGESSAKNLRGESMTDVIFNGSNGRKPVGQASIELVFDNTDKTLKGEYAAYNEISIKRKVTRDSQNIYYLNGTKCRRRDITDIFLGTGLGPRSYAIIEQGMISKLIEARPEELRVFIEEAAGISKYKERRRDTENRMRRTHENLERLTDIRDELERQLSRLERQAQAAEKYSEYKKEERSLKAYLQARRYLHLREKSQNKHGIITELELKVEAGVTRQVNIDTTIETQRVRFTEVGDKYHQVQERFYAIGADIARIEQTIAHSQDRERQLRVDLDQTEKDCREAALHHQQDADKAEGWQAELHVMEPELELLEEETELSSEKLIQAEEAMQAWQQEWDAFNQKAQAPRQQAEVQQSRIQHLETVQQRLLARIEKLDAEKRELVLGDVEDEIMELRESVAMAQEELEQLRLQIEEHSEKVTVQREQEQTLRAQLTNLQGVNQKGKGRLSSLEALQQSALGSGKGLSTWLKAQGIDSLPRLAESITVAGGWDRAVEIVLGKRIQAVAGVSDLGSLIDAHESLASGDCNVFTDGVVKGEGAVADSLASQVNSPFSIAGLLNTVFMADDIAHAKALQANLCAHESVITREGVWLGPNWLNLVKADDAGAGVIARQTEIEQLRGELDVQDEQIEALTIELETARQGVKDSEAARDEARKQLDQSQRVLSQDQTKLTAHTVKVEQVLARKDRVTAEINEAKEQLELEAEGLAQARMQLEDAIESMEMDTHAREELLAKRDQYKDLLENTRQKARQDKDTAHQLAMRIQAVSTQLQAVKQGLSRLSEHTAKLEERRQSLLDSLAEGAEPVELHKEELEAHLQKRVAVEEQLLEAKKSVEGVEETLRNAEKERLTVEQEVQFVRANLEKERLESQTYDVQAQNLRDQLEADDYNVDILLAELPEDAEADLEQALEKVAARISRLGPINLAAIDEYKTESERKNYLDDQDQDLMEALETLENAIRKIDKETRTRFKETFDQVNSGLQELFPKVFGGGHAYLELTGEDLLDTGITIMARPPGKRNSTIHLLSGGEKALTAIALVFSIFRLNPAPFCMLDEVDAPLDDANVGRYARMVEQMSSQVQFIYITHNKIAMEMADQLMGVTMHEPGCSRMVTVNVEEAAEMAAL